MTSSVVLYRCVCVCVYISIQVVNVDRALEMIGGTSAIERVVQLESKYLHLFFRPSRHVVSHPTSGDLVYTNNLLLRIKIMRSSRDRATENPERSRKLRVELVGQIPHTIKFRGLCDFQYLHRSKSGVAATTAATSATATATMTSTSPSSENRLRTTVESSLTTVRSGNNDKNGTENNVNNGATLHQRERQEEEVKTDTEMQEVQQQQQHQRQQIDQILEQMIGKELNLAPPIFSPFDTPLDYQFQANPLSETVAVPASGSSGIIGGKQQTVKVKLKNIRASFPTPIYMPFDSHTTVPSAPSDDILHVLGLSQSSFSSTGIFSGSSGSDDASDDILNDPFLQVMRELFERRPVWSRRAIEQQPQVMSTRSNFHKIRRYIPLVAYAFSTGPFRFLWVRYGFDPRRAREAAHFQGLDLRLPEEFKHLLKPSAAETESSNDLVIPAIAQRRRRPGAPKSKPRDSESASDATSQSSSSSYIFDNVPQQLNVIYQLCDIRLRSVQHIIALNRQNKCSTEHGWFEKETLDKIRSIMKSKVEDWLEKGDSKHDDDVMDEFEASANQLNE